MMVVALHSLYKALSKKKKAPANRKAAVKKTVAKKAPAKSPVKRAANPLKKWIVFVGPQFPDTEKGKQDALEFAQRFADQHKVAVHVYKA